MRKKITNFILEAMSYEPRAKSCCIFLLCLACLILPQIAQAATYYVAPAPDGNDANPGTEAQPWLTPTKAGNTAVAGDTVLFKPGTYSNSLNVAHSGTEGNIITFKSQTDHTAIFDFTGVKDDPYLTWWPINIASESYYAGNDYIRIEGFQIIGANHYAIFINNCDHIQIVNNHIHYCYGAAISNYVVDRGPIHDILIQDNTIHDGLVDDHDNPTNNPRGIFVDNATDVIIRNNTIYHNGDDGIYGGGDSWLVENNTFSDSYEEKTHQDAMDLGEMTNSIIRYNTFWDWTQYLYWHIGADGAHEYPVEVDNIDIYGNVFYTKNGGTVPGISLRVTYPDARLQVSHIRIHSNTFGYLGQGSICMDNCDEPDSIYHDIRIYDNIFYEQGIGITGNTDVSQFVSNYNLFYLPSAPAFEGANSITGTNPLFVDYQRYSSFDFRLAANSPCINVGNPNLGSVVTLPSPFVDIDGNERPQGAGYDLGAYEYTESFLYGDVSGDSEISAYDAALTAQAAVDLITLTPEQTKAADVSGDSEVTAYDAALIAQYSVGLISKFPVEG